MANNFDKILELVNAGNNMGLSNTIKRDYGIPLDYTSVQESYDAAVVYAATSTLAYVGQTVAVGGKLYIISDVANGTHTVGEGEAAKNYDNYLAEVGSKTEGDGNTIELDGQTLKLAGLTGLDNSKTYVPSLVNGKLIWAEPDTSTAEGQQAAISALEARATTLETVVNGKAESSEGAGDAVEGLVAKVATTTQAIADEVTAREAAIGVKASEGVEATGVYAEIAAALKEAKEYADAQDADTVYDDTKVKEDIAQNAADISALTGNVYTKAEIDGKVDTINDAIEGVNNTIAGITHFSTKIVASVDEVTAIGVLYLIKDDAIKGVDKYNEYLYIEGQGAVLIGDTTTDLSDYVTNDVLDAAIANFVNNDSLSSTLGDYAKTADVNNTLADYAKTADVVANTTFEEFKTANDTAIADARTGAVADVEAKGYALEANVAAELGKKIESGSIAHTSEGVVEGVTVEGTKLKIVVDSYTKEETLAKIEDKITEINGGESAGEVLSQLNSYKETNDIAVAALEAKDAAHDTAIEAAQAQADKGVADAKTANDAITAFTNGQVKANTDDISAVKTRLTTLETAKGDHETRIATAEGEIAALTAADVAINNKIGTIEGNITTLTNEDSRLAGLITALETNKANAADVYTKTDADAAIAAAIQAIPATDLSEYAKTETVEAALATKANAADVYTKTEADNAFMTEAEVDARINTLIVGADPEGGKTISDIQNLVKYVEENAGEIATLVTTVGEHTTGIATNTAAIAAINDAIAALVQPKASAEVTIAEDGTLGIGEVNVNKLVQTEGDTLVLSGGSAK